MNNDIFLGARTLAKGEVRRVALPVGQRVECLGGSLWITQDGDVRDVVVDAGQGFAFDRSGHALISALADSRYLLLEDCARQLGTRY